MLTSFVDIKVTAGKLVFGQEGSLAKANSSGSARYALTLTTKVSIAVSASKFISTLRKAQSLTVKNGSNVNVALNGTTLIARFKMVTTK